MPGKQRKPPTNCTEEAKEKLLCHLNENRHALFGQLKGANAIARKNLAWLDAFNFSKELGLGYKDIAHLQRIYNNWRRSLMAKMDAKKKTGGAGGEPDSQCDNYILSIERDNPKFNRNSKVSDLV